MDERPQVLVIVGTTASGKSQLAVDLAQQFNGEVISADSRQVYRHLDIGTAKVTPEEMQGVPHHCIDVANVDEVYTAKQFVAAAERAIADCVARAKLPIIAGGTFFYVDLLLGRATMPEVPPDPTLRAELESMSTQALYDELRERDSARAATIDPHNKRRLVRALEIVASLGRVPAIPSDEPYDSLWIGIERERADIRQRIAERAEHWITDGFRQEVGWLLDQDLPPERLTEFGFEYSIGAAWYRGELTDTQFVESIVAKNWHYAKRQLTWLRKNEHIHWVAPAAYDSIADLVTNWRKD